MLDFNFSDDVFTAIIVYGLIVGVVSWLALILWTYRDMRARSRDSFAQLGMAALVAVLNLPGLFAYLLIRPRETLSESYERSLEEEALLQEIEEKPVCPGCGQRVKDDWQVCAHCHTRLKKSCLSCRRLLELSWDICPHCATMQAPQQDDLSTLDYKFTPPPARPQQQVTLKRESPTANASSAEPIQFVEGDEY